MTATLVFESSAEATAGADFLSRLIRLDAGSLVRLRPAGARLRLWSRLPVGALASRELAGSVDADAVVSAQWLLDTLPAESPLSGPMAEPVAVSLSERLDAQWMGGLAPTDFAVFDEVPVAVLEQVAAAGGRAYREALDRRTARGARATTAGAKALAEAVLDHIALTVTGAEDIAGDGAEAEPVEIAQRYVQALSATGLLVGEAVEVGRTASWLRLATEAGAVHGRRGAALDLLTT